jgi:hypothetical protein
MLAIVNAHKDQLRIFYKLVLEQLYKLSFVEMQLLEKYKENFDVLSEGP